MLLGVAAAGVAVVVEASEAVWGETGSSRSLRSMCDRPERPFLLPDGTSGLIFHTFGLEQVLLRAKDPKLLLHFILFLGFSGTIVTETKLNTRY